MIASRSANRAPLGRPGRPPIAPTLGGVARDARLQLRRGQPGETGPVVFALGWARTEMQGGASTLEERMSDQAHNETYHPRAVRNASATQFCSI